MNHPIPSTIQAALDREAKRTSIIQAEFDPIDKAFATEAMIAAWTIEETRSRWRAQNPKRKTA